MPLIEIMLPRNTADETDRATEFNHKLNQKIYSDNLGSKVNNKRKEISRQLVESPVKIQYIITVLQYGFCQSALKQFINNQITGIRRQKDMQVSSYLNIYGHRIGKHFFLETSAMLKKIWERKKSVYHTWNSAEVNIRCSQNSFSSNAGAFNATQKCIFINTLWEIN